ncbi:long-chain-fatty-acid--CoA ligase 1 [Caerostris extrusa]|uniref:long-chain-fatty-acid--CoA ligase n=1 Tax=Caerostris extrusa TaxID=172846 RepID=A0AAV4W5D0_CAEEX|nr:long-chain-fatty-acid--CoA ligase 1 [Caerostris extrusa]
MSNKSVEVEPTEETEMVSIEIPNSGGARKSKLVTSGDTICHFYEDARTMWDVVQRGSKISNNGRCLGFRNFKPDFSWITYNEFIERAEHFGSGLIRMGLTPGQSSNVGIYAQNCIEWAVAQYGCWSQSAIIIPLYDTLGPDASIFIIKQAPKPSDICLICYTSGTTGDPKGVMLTHENLISATGSLMVNFPVSTEDSLISYLPSAHVYEQLNRASIFLNGASIGFFSGDVAKLVEDMKILQPTIFQLYQEF